MLVKKHAKLASTAGLLICLLALSIVSNFYLISRRLDPCPGIDHLSFWPPPPATRNNAVLRDESSITRAVNTMRCFTTPGCYPSIRCANKDKEPMSLAVKAHHERHSFCTGDLNDGGKKARGGENRCVIYSFGIDKNTEWESKAANLFGCDVHAFDPTSDFPERIAPGVMFHKLGLQGVGTNVSATHSVEYDAIDPSRLRTLGEIVRSLGHEGRIIDVLKLDCEGCEYGVLKELACNGDDGKFVRQLMSSSTSKGTLD